MRPPSVLGIYPTIPITHPSTIYANRRTLQYTRPQALYRNFGFANQPSGASTPLPTLFRKWVSSCAPQSLVPVWYQRFVRFLSW